MFTDVVDTSGSLSEPEKASAVVVASNDSERPIHPGPLTKDIVNTLTTLPGAQTQPPPPVEADDKLTGGVRKPFRYSANSNSVMYTCFL